MASHLSPKMRRFVEAYLGAADGNGAKAAIAAGYSHIGASQAASRLLTRTDVKAALQRIADKADLSTAKTLERVGHIASAIPVKISDMAVLKANELILKVNGALNDKHSESRVTVTIGFLTQQPSPTCEVQVMPPLQPRVLISGE